MRFFPYFLCGLNYRGNTPKLGRNRNRFILQPSLISGIKKLVIPAFNSVFSAYGIAGSDIVQVERHSEPMLAPFDPDRLNAIFGQMEEKLISGLEKNKVASEKMTLLRSMDLRYWGQVHEISVAIPPGALTAADAENIVPQFVGRYENKYGKGTSYGAAQLEAVTLEVKGIGMLDKPSLKKYTFAGTDPSEARKGQRDVYFEDDNAFRPTDIYTREKLKVGNRIKGPAVIEAVDTTILVNPGQEITVDEFFNLVMEL